MLAALRRGDIKKKRERKPEKVERERERERNNYREIIIRSCRSDAGREKRNDSGIGRTSTRQKPPPEVVDWTIPGNVFNSIGPRRHLDGTRRARGPGAGGRRLTRSKGEGTSVSGGNEAFATRTPILYPFCVLPNATFEPSRPDCGRSPNRTFCRPLSGGRGARDGDRGATMQIVFIFRLS